MSLFKVLHISGPINSILGCGDAKTFVNAAFHSFKTTNVDMSLFLLNEFPKTIGMLCNMRVTIGSGISKSKRSRNAKKSETPKITKCPVASTGTRYACIKRHKGLNLRSNERRVLFARSRTKTSGLFVVVVDIN